MLAETKLRDLESVRDVLEGLRTLSTDVKVAPRDITEVCLDSITVPSLGQLALTPDALIQMAGRIGIPGATMKWLRKEAPDKAQELLSDRWYRYQGGILEGVQHPNELLVRARELPDGAGGTKTFARAVLSDRYGIIDSADLVGALLNSLPEHLAGAKVGGMKNRVWIDPVSGRINVKGIIQDRELGGPEDKHCWGFLANNDECGGGAADVGLLFERLFCTNQFAGLGLGGRESRKIHMLGKNGLDIDQFNTEVGTWMAAKFSGVEDTFRKYWMLNDRRVENPGEVLLRLGRLNDLSRTDLTVVAETILPKYVEHDGSTAYAIVNSLTEFARDMQDREKQALWESVAGKIIDVPARQWA